MQVDQTGEYVRLGMRGSLLRLLRGEGQGEGGGRSGGVRVLYRGWTVTVLRAVPANAVIFSIYELITKCYVQ